MRKTNRSIRRKERARLKKVRKHYWWGASVDGPLTGKYLGMAVNTSTPCSCWMCCNPRKSWVDDTPKGMTVKEVSDNELADLMETEYVK
jgi:hypothetical protein